MANFHEKRQPAGLAKGKLRIGAAWFVFGLSQCAPAPSPPTGAESSAPRATAVRNETVPVASSAVPVRPSPSAGDARLVTFRSGIVTFEGVAFDSRRHRLAVADQAGGPGSRFASAATAGKSMNAIVAVNGGFFTPEGEPLGLVISSGKRSGQWNGASSLGGGIWHQSPGGQTQISRRSELTRASAAGMSELLQAGPLLVDQGSPTSGLDQAKTSARIVLLWDGGHRWWIGRSSPCTLAQAGQACAGSPAGWPVRRALNLDGGRSADLWISDSVAGGPLTRRPTWNRPVRNFLVLLPR